MLRSRTHTSGPLLDSLQYVHVSCTEEPRSGHSTLDLEGKGHLPSPAGSVHPKAAQAAVARVRFAARLSHTPQARTLLGCGSWDGVTGWDLCQGAAGEAEDTLGGI